MVDLSYWSVFFTAALLLNLAPGPDVLYILTKTLTSGTRVGLAASLGVCTGALFHVGLAALGVSAILLASALAFTLVKFVGAAYLMILAYQSLSSGSDQLDVSEDAPTIRETPWQAYKQGVLIDILNPKVAIFFMAFLPQFLRSGEGPVWQQLLLLGLLVVLLAVFVEFAYVLLAATLFNRLPRNSGLWRWLNRLVAGVYVALGLRLATSSAP